MARNNAALAPVQTLSALEQIQALMANMSGEDRKAAKALFKKEATQRNPDDTRKLIEIKTALRDEAEKRIRAAGLTPTDDALAQVFLAHWPKKYHQLQQGSNGQMVRTGVTWEAGGPGNQRPQWVKSGKPGINYQVEELVGQ